MAAKDQRPAVPQRLRHFGRRQPPKAHPRRKAPAEAPVAARMLLRRSAPVSQSGATYSGRAGFRQRKIESARRIRAKTLEGHCGSRLLVVSQGLLDLPQDGMRRFAAGAWGDRAVFAFLSNILRRICGLPGGPTRRLRRKMSRRIRCGSGAGRVPSALPGRSWRCRWSMYCGRYANSRPLRPIAHPSRRFDDRPRRIGGSGS